MMFLKKIDEIDFNSLQKEKEEKNELEVYFSRVIRKNDYHTEIETLLGYPPSWHINLLNSWRYPTDLAKKYLDDLNTLTTSDMNGKITITNNFKVEFRITIFKFKE